MEMLYMWTQACETSVAAALHDCYDEHTQLRWGGGGTSASGLPADMLGGTGAGGSSSRPGSRVGSRPSSRQAAAVIRPQLAASDMVELMPE